MTRPAPQVSLRTRVVAVVLLAHVLAGIALAASPRLHHWVHPDADADDHDCAVVLFLHGGCHPAPPISLAVIVASRPPVWTMVKTQAWVASIFAECGVFEHAPPGAESPSRHAGQS